MLRQGVVHELGRDRLVYVCVCKHVCMEQYATKETYGSPQFLLTREEVKCLLRAYDEGEPGKEEQVTEREECPVEEEHDSQHHKQRPKRGQCNANLLRVREPHHGWIPVCLAGGLSDDGYA